MGFEEVLRFCNGEKIARRAVWVTFDDGHPSVIENALPELDETEIPATAFICPSVVDTSEPFWWQVIAMAGDIGVKPDGRPLGERETARLKSIPDAERRAFVAKLRGLAEEHLQKDLEMPQITMDQLSRWTASGRHVGNHSWDHPLFDQVPVHEQRRQVMLAHDWINENIPQEGLFFAYPNGNATSFVEGVLRQVGYEAALLFDHRLAGPTRPLGLSRIRVNGTDDLALFRIKVSGAHPSARRLVRRALIWLGL